jgi:hypothetical protein
MDGLFFGPGVIAMNRFSDWGALRALVVACVLAVSGSVAAQPQTTEAIWRDPAGLIVIDLAASGAAAISSPPKAMVQNQLARFTLDPFTGAPHCFVDREALDIAEMTPEQTFALFRRLIMERRAFQESLRPLRPMERLGLGFERPHVAAEGSVFTFPRPPKYDGAELELNILGADGVTRFRLSCNTPIAERAVFAPRVEAIFEGVLLAPAP